MLDALTLNFTLTILMFVYFVMSLIESIKYYV